MFSRRIVLVLTIAAMAALPAGAARAECGADFDIAKARGFKASLVRMFMACPTTDHPSGNNETEGGVPGCTPVRPAEVDEQSTPYDFGRVGSCTLSWKPKVVSDCSTLVSQAGTPLGLPADPCHVASVRAECTDIRDGLGIPINADETGWTLRATVRATIEDPALGPMTLVDLPLVFPFEAPNGGHLSMSQTTAEAMAGIGEVLPPCTNLEIVRLSMHDPEGLPFATLGIATIP